MEGDFELYGKLQKVLDESDSSVSTKIETLHMLLFAYAMIVSVRDKKSGKKLLRSYKNKFHRYIQDYDMHVKRVNDDFNRVMNNKLD